MPTAPPTEDPIGHDEAAALLAPFLPGGAGVTGTVIAVSGGPDSMALMRLAASVAPPEAPPTVATVDHGLRPHAAIEAAQVADWAAQCGLPHRLLTWAGAKPKTRIQERARQMRYELLLGLAREIGASHLVTGHTLDDQAETVVMRLLRGSGVSGLSGMRASSEVHGIVLARPFLALRKARLVATCRGQGWAYLEDPSNADPVFARARLRHGLMPALAHEGFTPERAAALAQRAYRAEAALAARAEAVLARSERARAPGRLDLDAALLAAEPEAILLGIVARAIVAVLGTATRAARLERFERIVLTEIAPALRTGQKLRRTLAGALLETGSGRLRISPEPLRAKKAVFTPP